MAVFVKPTWSLIPVLNMVLNVVFPIKERWCKYKSCPSNVVFSQRSVSTGLQRNVITTYQVLNVVWLTENVTGLWKLSAFLTRRAENAPSP